MNTELFNDDSLVFGHKNIPEGKVTLESPSNIALVKYWGKRPVQIPMNPSISFTLTNAKTVTTVNYKPSEKNESKLKFYFRNQRNTAFEEKTVTFFEMLHPLFPFLRQLDFEIHSENTFPHSAGIASSASGMSALALALCEMERIHFGKLQNREEYLRKASYAARLGSGSACRSVIPQVALWGSSPYLSGSSDLYAVRVKEVHPVFKEYRDAILIADAGAKKVSSRAGHALMNNNPFAGIRFRQAANNTGILLKALKEGDLENFIEITESEALTLHAMMMTSLSGYLLLKPVSITLMERIRNFRKETAVPVAFTLDAGPNVHLLYPEKYENEVKRFIISDLSDVIGNDSVIYDKMGKGWEGE